jgi:hypothetical protein
MWATSRLLSTQHPLSRRSSTTDMELLHGSTRECSNVAARNQIGQHPRPENRLEGHKAEGAFHAYSFYALFHSTTSESFDNQADARFSPSVDVAMMITFPATTDPLSSSHLRPLRCQNLALGSWTDQILPPQGSVGHPIGRAAEAASSILEGLARKFLVRDRVFN